MAKYIVCRDVTIFQTHILGHTSFFIIIYWVGSFEVINDLYSVLSVNDSQHEHSVLYLEIDQELTHSSKYIFYIDTMLLSKCKACTQRRVTGPIVTKIFHFWDLVLNLRLSVSRCYCTVTR